MVQKRLLFVSSLAVALSSLVCVSAAAVEDVTVTTLDPVTGEVIGEGDEVVAAENPNLIYITASMSFDRETGEFVISSGGVSDGDIRSNVPNGIITSDPVKIVVPDNTTPTLYRDGYIVTDEELDNITTPGSYVLDLMGALTRSSQPLKFTIISDTINSPDMYRLPDGFVVDYVLLNGETQYSSTIMVDLTAEGEYDIKYGCMDAEKSFQLRVTKDVTPPNVVLEGVTEGKAKGPVTVRFDEDMSTLSVNLTKDGQAITYESTLKEMGKYTLSATDRAGNSSTYDFQIQFYFNLNSIFFLLLFGVSAAALIIYLLLTRKKLRIR